MRGSNVGNGSSILWGAPVHGENHRLSRSPTDWEPPVRTARAADAWLEDPTLVPSYTRQRWTHAATAQFGGAAWPGFISVQMSLTA